MTAEDEVRALREKYRELSALRRHREEDEASGRAHVPSRERLRALAHRFPGALAEIDRLSPALLAERTRVVEELAARAETEGGLGARLDPATLPAWVRGWIAVHRGLRGALSAKAWLAGRRRVDEATRARFEAALLVSGALPHAEDARAFRERLAEIADPPGGRLLDLVLEDAARELGTERASLRALLLPPGLKR